HYLDVELDLSDVFFIATANFVEGIPGPLLDRMEVIPFDGYTVDEKVAIAEGYLWPRQRELNGLRVDEAAVRDALGRQKFFHEAAERTAVPGVATGLAVTGTGGDVLFVEATSHKGNGDVLLTGQLGDVMKESARIALSYVKSAADSLGIPEDAFENRSFHVHVPAGAIPKDGPSA